MNKNILVIHDNKVRGPYVNKEILSRKNDLLFNDHHHGLITLVR